MAVRKFLELKMNFIKHATIQRMVMSRSEWKQTSHEVVDCQSQHHSTGYTFGYHIGEKIGHCSDVLIPSNHGKPIIKITLTNEN